MPHPHGELSPGEDGVQADEQVVVHGDVLLEGGGLGGELRPGCGRSPSPPWPGASQLLLAFTTPMGSMKKVEPEPDRSWTRPGISFFELRLHRHHVPPRALGDDVLLEVLGLGGGEDGLQNVPHLALRGPHVPGMEASSGLAESASSPSPTMEPVILSSREAGLGFRARKRTSMGVLFSSSPSP